MPVFEYKGFDSAGGSLKGVMTADTPEEARRLLRTQGVHVRNIKGIEKKRRTISFTFAARDELTTVSRQLATLLASGTNLADAIQVVLKQIENPGLSSAFMEILESIRRGISFGHALEEFPQYFSPLYIDMVKAGEASGSLNVILGRIADYYQKRKKVMGGITSAMIYPSVVILLGTGVVSFLMVYVVPRLIKLFKQNSASAVLPLPTQILIFASNLIRNWWFIVIPFIGLVIFLFFRFFRSEHGRYVFDRTILKIPVLGNLFRKSTISRFATTFSTLLKSGIAPLDALLIVQDILNNKFMEKALLQVRQGVLDGNDMSFELEKTGVFPPIVGHMVSIGEQSGELENLLEDLAESYDTEVELATEKFISVLEPIMIVIMAAVIGFIVFAIVLPILEIGNIQ